jgi:hypothetical protein
VKPEAKKRCKGKCAQKKRPREFYAGRAQCRRCYNDHILARRKRALRRGLCRQCRKPSDAGRSCEECLQLHRERNLRAKLHRFSSRVASAAWREASRVRAGYVYVITNDVFPCRLKIGSAVDAESRLGDAQTWDPRRRFRVAHRIFTLDRNRSERRIHHQLRRYRLEGEWFGVTLRRAKEALDREATATKILRVSRNVRPSR